MKAVLWTDVFQSLLMFAAIFAVLTKGVLDAGGITNVLNAAYEDGRLEFFRLDVDPTVRHTFWTQAIGGIFTYVSIHGVNQTQVQRLLTAGSLKRSQMAQFISLPILTLLSVTTSCCGLVIYHAYRSCDPVDSQRISSFDKLLPLYVMDHLSFYPGVSGLFVSGIFSGALSTISSAVNSLAAVTLEDYVKPNLRSRWSDTKLSFLSQLLVLFYGGVCLGIAFLAEHLGGLLQASLTVFGVVGGPLLGLFTLGMATTRSSQKGALVGLCSGLIISCWFGFGASIYKPYNPELPRSVDGCSSWNSSLDTRLNVSLGTLNSASSFSNFTLSSTAISRTNDHIFYPYRISYMWLAPIGLIVTMVVGYFVSLATGGNEIPDADLISPPFQILFSLKPRTADVSKENGMMPEDMECAEKLVTLDKGSMECMTKL